MHSLETRCILKQIINGVSKHKDEELYVSHGVHKTWHYLVGSCIILYFLFLETIVCSQLGKDFVPPPSLYIF